MEDLGDALLQSVAAHGEKARFLEKATEVLAHLHTTTYPVPQHLPVSTRAFDKTKFLDELKFTEEHLIRNLLGFPSWTQEHLTRLDTYCESLAAIKPRVFCHRDYHTRNILITRQRLWLIDFQDARMGAPHYDLASLLYDSYTVLSAREREWLRNIYENRGRGCALHAEIDWEHFDRDLQQMALQRLIKAAGSFASFFTRLKKTSHLRYIGPALEMAQPLANAWHLAEVFPIAQWLAKLKTAKLDY
jgi:aminoglycoside/choline kinase family phosphotransferase